MIMWWILFFMFGVMGITEFIRFLVKRVSISEALFMCFTIIVSSIAAGQLWP